MHISGTDALGFGLALLVEHVRHDHCCTVSNEALSDGEANATGCASDDGDAIAVIQDSLLVCVEIACVGLEHDVCESQMTRAA
jgi:hypothetical protein